MQIMNLQQAYNNVYDAKTTKFIIIYIKIAFSNILTKIDAKSTMTCHDVNLVKYMLLLFYFKPNQIFLTFLLFSFLHLRQKANNHFYNKKKIEQMNNYIEAFETPLPIDEFDSDIVMEEPQPQQPEFDYKQFLRQLSLEELHKAHMDFLAHCLTNWHGLSPAAVEELNEFDATINEKQYELAAKSYLNGKSKILDAERLQKWKINYYKELNKYDLETAIVTYERFNPAAMEWLLKNKQTLCWRFGVKVNDVNNLIKYNSISKHGWAKIYYFKCKKYSKENNSLSMYGRMFAIKGVSLQSMCKKFRATLSRGMTFEADICNCHPTVLQQVCKNHGIDTPYITEYRDNREKHLKDLMDANNITRSWAKEVFITAMYSDHNGSKPLNDLRVKTPFLKKLHKEFIQALEIIVEQNPELYNDMKTTLARKHKEKYEAWLKAGKRWDKPKKKASAKPSTVSYYVQEIENKILQCSIEFYKEHGIIKNDDYTMIFDGTLLPVKYLDRFNRLQAELTAKIKEEIGIEITFGAKQWGEETNNPTKYEFLQCDDPELQEAYDAAADFMKHGKKALLSYKEYLKFDLIRVKNTTIPCKPIGDVAANKGEFLANIELSQRKLPSLNLWLNNNRTLIIKSGMGTSKTKRFYEYLDEQLAQNYNQKVLIISFRKSLERKYMEDLGSKGFVLYDDIKTAYYDSRRYPKLIVQVNSLWRVIGEYDTVLLDEISYTLDTLIDYSQHKTQITQALKSYIKNCKKLICLDAFLTNVECNYIKSIRGNDQCLIINNSKKKRAGTCVELKENNFIETMMEKILAGKKIVIASNVKKFLLNKIEPLLQKHQITYKFITRDSSEITNVTDWNNYQVIGYSPTIVAGLSFEIPEYFDYRFGYFSNLSATPDICIQMLFRVRSTTHNEIFLCIKDNNFTSKDFPVTDEEITEWLNIYANLDCKQEFKELGIRTQSVNAGWLVFDNFTRKYIKDEYYYLVLNYFRKRFLAKKYFANRLMYYLQVQGWYGKAYTPTIEEMETLEKQTKKSKKIIKEYSIEQTKATVKEYREAAKCPIDESLYQTLVEKQRKTPQDKINMNVYLLTETFDIDLRECKDKEIECAVKNFFYHKFEQGFIRSRLESPMKFVTLELKNIPKGNQEDWHIQRKRDFFLRAYRILRLIEIMKIDGLFDLNREYIMDEANIQEVSDYIFKNMDDFVHLFNFKRNDEKYKFRNKKGEISIQSFMQIINSIFKRIGRKIFKERNRRRKGRKMTSDNKYYFRSIITFESNKTNISHMIDDVLSEISEEQLPELEETTEPPILEPIIEEIIETPPNRVYPDLVIHDDIPEVTITPEPEPITDLTMDHSGNHNGNWIPPNERF